MIEPATRPARARERYDWDPPEEPPPQVRSELLWRVAVRLYRDHARDRQVPAEDEPRCARCPHPWPCAGRRLAELALTAATS
jgi:hypothetical protein